MGWGIVLRKAKLFPRLLHLTFFLILSVESSDLVDLLPTVFLLFQHLEAWPLNNQYLLLNMEKHLLSFPWRFSHLRNLFVNKNTVSCFSKLFSIFAERKETGDISSSKGLIILRIVPMPTEVYGEKSHFLYWGVQTHKYCIQFLFQDILSVSQWVFLFSALCCRLINCINLSRCNLIFYRLVLRLAIPSNFNNSSETFIDFFFVLHK